MKYSNLKLLKYFIYLLFIILFSGCSILFPTPDKKLRSIERHYIQTQLKFDRTLENSFTNDQVDSLEDQYEDLFEEADSLLKTIERSEKNNEIVTIDKDLVKYYRTRIQNKLIICQDLKD